MHLSPLLVPDGPAPAAGATDALQQVLQVVRRRLGMDVAFIAEFVDDRRVFRWVDAVAPIPGLSPGLGDPLEDTFCQRIVDGRLDRIVPDTAANPVTAPLPFTRGLGIGNYLGTPLRLSTGEVYGTLCCFSATPDRTLNARDLDYLDDVAEIVTVTLSAADASRREQARIRGCLAELERNGGPVVVVQPIVDLTSGKIAGSEALSRFPTGSPLTWFEEAARVGEGIALERSAIRNALAASRDTPGFMSLNLSPTTILAPGTLALFDDVPLDRLIVELTEQEKVDDLTDVRDALAPLRRRGLRVAIDDVGAGYAGLNRVVQLRPDIIKLDIGLVRGIEGDEIRQALSRALISFAQGSGSKVIAEGVETAGELRILRALGADYGQGWLFSRPCPPAQLTDAVVFDLDGL
ncbi:EAL domain-containing protein (putative c-di-GMP-specific phosphodiesterase class I) [Catenuloplanes nepalensis]|uniref:EAL domain-containing protein (Putative c-di-GMP-specific phosphodiesterase class I) n=1 Tax=Catenuloplanes nepalensis TaxID=587533 RepID=A0ABT9N6T4_9ACTN|nr:EAL domain-containing protein [Catenuloplanes nepalensis]MDP9799408.1 EAL domain-containing protein (putative c-di-GMP-specific phosphodiesterase class I) [Catenuloplanes nepalensis]